MPQEQSVFFCTNMPFKLLMNYRYLRKMTMIANDKGLLPLHKSIVRRKKKPQIKFAKKRASHRNNRKEWSVPYKPVLGIEVQPCCQ